MGWISLIYAVVSVASILFSSKSFKVFNFHPSVLCHSGARGFQLHPSILFSSKSCRVFSCIYSSCFHPRAGEFLFQPRAGGFPLHTSVHPLFIKDLQGFQLHPCILFSSRNWQGFRCIHPSFFHPRPRRFPFASFLFFIYELEGSPLHPPILLFIYEPEGFHFTHPSSFFIYELEGFPLQPSILFFIQELSGTQGQKALGRAVITGYEDTCKLRIGQGQMATLIMGMWKIPKKTTSAIIRAITSSGQKLMTNP